MVLKIQQTTMMYILTRIWVLHTPNSCQDLLFHIFRRFSQYFEAKMMKNKDKKQIFTLFTNVGWHKKHWFSTLENWWNKNLLKHQSRLKNRKLINSNTNFYPYAIGYKNARMIKLYSSWFLSANMPKSCYIGSPKFPQGFSFYVSALLCVFIQHAIKI